MKGIFDDMQDKKANAATITKQLKKLGFKKAEWLASGRVKGWGNWTTGFTTTNDTEHINGRHVEYKHYTQKRGWHTRYKYVEDTVRTGVVIVEFIQGNWKHQHDENGLQKIADALASLGYAVKTEEYGFKSKRLRVTL